MSFVERTMGCYGGPLPPGLLDHIAERLADLATPERGEDWLRIVHGRAESELRLMPSELRISIRAADAVQLYHAREGALHLLDQVCPEVGAGIVWMGPEADPHPPSLHPATLLSRERIGASFLRLTMACAGTAALATGGMHFSLLLPPDGRDPVWPRLNARGRTVWPEGADALHRAAYTFVKLDPAAGHFAFDLFLHPGSRACAWALSAPVGTSVAVMGPGGGDAPEADHLLLAGDETALPAIRRILEGAPPDRRGRVLIEIGDDADRCDLVRPAAMHLGWIRRHAGETLLGALRGIALDAHAPFVWVAAEQATVREARAHFENDARFSRARSCFAAYWRRETS